MSWHWAILRDEVTLLLRQRKGLPAACCKNNELPKVSVGKWTAYEALFYPIPHGTWGKGNWCKHTDGCLKSLCPWIFHKLINPIFKPGHFELCFCYLKPTTLILLGLNLGNTAYYIREFYYRLAYKVTRSLAVKKKKKTVSFCLTLGFFIFHEPFHFF